MDFNLSDRNKIAYDFRHNYRLQHKNFYFNDPAFGDLLSRKNWGTSLDDIYTLSPSLILDVRGKLDPVPRDQRISGRWHRSRDLRISLLSGGEFTVRRVAVHAVCRRLLGATPWHSNVSE